MQKSKCPPGVMQSKNVYFRDIPLFIYAVYHFAEKTCDIMKRRRKFRKALLIIPVAVMGLAVFLLVLGVNQGTQAPEKKKSSEYFVLSGIAALGRYGLGTNESVLIKTLGFNFTPIGGDATEVTLFLEGTSDPLDFFWPRINKGQSQFSGEISPPFPIEGEKVPGGWVVQARIFSHEADGYINVTIPDRDMHILSGSS